MMINERFKVLRKTLKLTQEELGLRLNMSKSNISRIEKGKNSVTDRIINDLCREFNVNEHWLREGSGEMFCTTDKFSLDDYLNKKGLNNENKEIFKKIAEVYVKINDDERKNFVKSLIDTIEFAFK